MTSICSRMSTVFTHPRVSPAVSQYKAQPHPLSFCAYRGAYWRCSRIASLVVLSCFWVIAGCDAREPGALQSVQTQPTSQLDTPSRLSRPGLSITGIDEADLDNLGYPRLLNISSFRRQAISSLSTDISVRLATYRESIPAGDLVAYYQRDLDECYLRTPSLYRDTLASDDPPSLFQIGESLVFQTLEGPWKNLFLTTNTQGEAIYSVTNHRSIPFPEDLSLSIDGGEFMRIDKYAISEPDAIERLLPTVQTPVNRNTVYSWLPGGTEAYVKISLLSFDNNNVFEGFAVTCRVEDNGTFVMPEEVKDYIDSSNSVLRARFSRVSQRLDFQEDGVIRQLSEVSE